MDIMELRDMVVEMRVELRNANAELQLQKDKMADLERDNAGKDIMCSELKELRDMVVEMRVELRNANAELQLKKDKMADLERDNTVLTTKLAAMEKTVMPLTYKLAAMEKTVEDMMPLTAKLKAMKKTVKPLTSTLADIERTVKPLTSKLADMEKTVEDMMSLTSKLAAIEETIAEKPNVAFCASLSPEGHLGYFGPHNIETKLIYKGVVTNISQGYDPVTGYFTAPVKGVYYFRFTAYHNCKGDRMGVRLYHDDQRILWNEEKTDGFTYISNALILQLEKGSVVSMRLPEFCRLNDNGNKQLNTFSGFLLFPIKE